MIKLICYLQFCFASFFMDVIHLSIILTKHGLGETGSLPALGWKCGERKTFFQVSRLLTDTNSQTDPVSESSSRYWTTCEARCPSNPSLHPVISSKSIFLTSHCSITCIIINLSGELNMLSIWPEKVKTIPTNRSAN